LGGENIRNEIDLITMFEIQKLATKKDALRVINFLQSDEAFQDTWVPGEKEMIRNTVLESLNKSKHHQYWYIEKKGKIIGALGVNENVYESGGYEMMKDYIAVHKDYKRHGLGTKLLKTMEDYVWLQKGRYILITTCDTDYYKPARLFYEKHGYVKVGAIPDYYLVGEGKIDYLKKM